MTDLQNDVNVMEEAVLLLQKERTVDVQELLSQIRGLVTRAEEAAQKIGKLVMLDPEIPEPYFVTCPFDSAHRVSPESLFKHFLACPSNPTPQADAQKLISSLGYPHTQPQDLDEDYHQTADLDSRSLGVARHSSLVNPGGVNLSSEDMTVASWQLENKSERYRSGIVRNATEDALNTSVSNEIDIWGGRFFYKNCPAVVQAPLVMPYASLASGTLLHFTNAVEQPQAKVERADGVYPVSLPDDIGRLPLERGSHGDGLRPLLPSRFWFLIRETEIWKELPTRCSCLVLQAASGLGRIRKKMLLEWMLMQSPAHGIVIDSALANHIYSLAKICLKALQKESSVLIDHQSALVKTSVSENAISHGSALDRKAGSESNYEGKMHELDAGDLTKVKKEGMTVGDEVTRSCNIGRSFKVTCLDCPRLFQSGHWLASQLLCLFGPQQSNTFVLNLLKQCLVSSGRCLTSVCIDAFTKKADDSRPQQGRSYSDKFGVIKREGEMQTLEEGRSIGDKLLKAVNEPVEGSLLPLELDAAIAAIHERAVLEGYLRSLKHPSKSSKFQVIQEHEAAVIMAAEERSKRLNYRPVSEYDGLVWHRSQLEENNKNKTREELLAEERDYKRRRMSYRGKKSKRNPTQVLHDIIEGHMGEIVEAGGIGCFTKHPGELPLPAETGKVESSRKSNLSCEDDVIQPKWLHNMRSPVASPTALCLSSQDKRTGRNDHFEGQPGRQDNWSNEHSRFKNISEDFDNNGLRHMKYLRLDVGSTLKETKESSRKSDDLQGRSYRRDSHLDSGRLEMVMHCEERSSYHRHGQDRGRDKRHREDSNNEKEHTDRTVHKVGSDYETDVTHIRRHIERWEFSTEDDDFKHHHTGSERRGKCKSRP